MKKIVILLAAMLMAMSASAWAADAAANQKLEKAKELRVQAAKLSMQALDLNRQATVLEMEAELKPGEKMRGGNPWATAMQLNEPQGAAACSYDCRGGGHGDKYICNRACGNY